MLSSLTSFLPNALHLPNQSSGSEPPAKEAEKPDDSSATTEGGDAESMVANEMGMRRKEKRGANEVNPIPCQTLKCTI